MVSRRLAAISESATMAITAKAAARRAAGHPVIGYGAGEPDFPTPDHIVEAAVAAARDPRSHKYSAAAGLPELRAAVADKTERDSGYRVDPGQVVITNGGKGAVFAGFAAILDPGDEVLIPAPYWVSHPAAAQLAGGVVRIIETTIDSGFKVGVHQLEAARTDRTKALVFVSPSNPTGAVYTPAEVRVIGAWAAEHDIWVMSDEIYEHLIYTDTPFASIPVEVPAMARRSLVVNGVAKTYAMTGWRVGWLIAPPAEAQAAIKLSSHSTSNVANVSQRAALAAVTGGLEETASMRRAFDRRRRTMHEMLSAIDGVRVEVPEGAFYCFPSLHGLLGRQVGHRRPETTLDLADAVLESADVAFVPGEAFGAPGYGRLSFALGDAELVEGLSRLQSLFR